jgi:hypothetical protein
VQSAISAPLVHRDELLGVLNVRTMLEGALTDMVARAASLVSTISRSVS